MLGRINKNMVNFYILYVNFGRVMDFEYIYSVSYLTYVTEITLFPEKKKCHSVMTPFKGESI